MAKNNYFLIVGAILLIVLGLVIGWKGIVGFFIGACFVIYLEFSENEGWQDKLIIYRSLYQGMKRR